MYDFGIVLRELRKKKKLTQEKLAEKLDVTAGTISKYESNQVYPPFETMRSLAVILDVSMDELCGTSQNDVISTCGLSDEQVRIVKCLVDSFRNQNTIYPKKINDEQCLLLGRIVTEFIK